MIQALLHGDMHTGPSRRRCLHACRPTHDQFLCNRLKSLAHAGLQARLIAEAQALPHGGVYPTGGTTSAQRSMHHMNYPDQCLMLACL